MIEENKLKLRAVAAEDIEILSTLLQDGLVASSDLHYEKDESWFVMVINRFCWEQANDGEPETQPNRCLCGLKVGHVKHVSQRGLSAASTQFYNLLSSRLKRPKRTKRCLRADIHLFRWIWDKADPR